MSYDEFPDPFQSRTKQVLLTMIVALAMAGTIGLIIILSRL